MKAELDNMVKQATISLWNKDCMGELTSVIYHLTAIGIVDQSRSDMDGRALVTSQAILDQVIH